MKQLFILHTFAALPNMVIILPTELKNY